MTIAELGALGEFLGSVGVLITLIYLAIQVQQTKRQIGSNTNALLGASEINGNDSTHRSLMSMYSDESCRTSWFEDSSTSPVCPGQIE